MQLERALWQRQLRSVEFLPLVGFCVLNGLLP